MSSCVKRLSSRRLLSSRFRQVAGVRAWASCFLYALRCRSSRKSLCMLLFETLAARAIPRIDLSGLRWTFCATVFNNCPVLTDRGRPGRGRSLRVRVSLYLCMVRLTKSFLLLLHFRVCKISLTVAPARCSCTTAALSLLLSMTTE